MVRSSARPGQSVVVRVPRSRIDANYDRFRAALVELRDLLREHAPEQPWADWAGRTLTRTEAGDAGGFDYWLAAYGGMGSINDLSIDWRLAPDDRYAVAARMAELRGRCHELAAQLRIDLAENTRADDHDNQG